MNSTNYNGSLKHYPYAYENVKCQPNFRRSRMFGNVNMSLVNMISLRLSEDRIILGNSVRRNKFDFDETCLWKVVG